MTRLPTRQDGVENRDTVYYRTALINGVVIHISSTFLKTLRT